ncbi:SymE family type I addiction module toxin [Dielma fastidiosa]
MRYKSVPQIRMQGKWLEELGFESGSEINVECLDGKLIITKKEAITE